MVYATEIGYSYSGDEYWQTFESETPGWAAWGDRGFIRRRFQDFAAEFNGAVPSGTWANWFSIIAWPITHAVLPRDLQRQLAQLLYDYRHRFTSGELNDPIELGRQLAVSAWNTSSRFQNFAQNPDLLGQVASALLSGSDDESPYLLSSTLNRIVADLSKQQEARQWLRDATRAATQVRTRGLLPGSRRTTSTLAPSREQAPPPSPKLTVRLAEGGWAAHMLLPDLSPLAERSPALGDRLKRLRSRVQGVAGPPLARGRLLFPGQILRLHNWPDPDKPLLEFEEATELERTPLGDFRISSGPNWVFRLIEPAVGVEVRSKIVRPGHSYVIMASTLLKPEAVDGLAIHQEPTATEGVHAYRLDIPAPLGTADARLMRDLGLAPVMDIEILPVGLPPAAWDGEGSAEWFVGTSPLFLVRSERHLSHLVASIDGESKMFPWPDTGGDFYLSLDELGLGEHVLQLTLVPKGPESPTEGSLAISILDPPSASVGGTSRDALVVMPNPASANLDDFWSGSAYIDVFGPPGDAVAVSVALREGSGQSLAETTFEMTLPIDGMSWRRAFSDNIRNLSAIHRSYDRAEQCDITFVHDEIGTAKVRCSRSFTPLRWASGSDRQGPFLQLIDRTGRPPLSVERRPFDTPASSEVVPLASNGVVRWPKGGLFVASLESMQTAAILPADVRSLGLQQVRPRPTVALRERSVQSVIEHVELAALWASAPVSTDAFGAHGRLSVIRAIAGNLASLVGQGYWERIERRVASQDSTLRRLDFANAVGAPGPPRKLGRTLVRLDEKFARLSQSDRFELFQMTLRACGIDDARGLHRAPEVLFRLASDLGTLGEWPRDQLFPVVERILQRPVLLRAARVVVLTVERLGSAGDITHPYPEFVWD